MPEIKETFNQLLSSAVTNDQIWPTDLQQIQKQPNLESGLARLS